MFIGFLQSEKVGYKFARQREIKAINHIIHSYTKQEKHCATLEYATTAIVINGSVGSLVSQYIR